MSDKRANQVATRWLLGLNKYNAPEVLGLLFRALEQAGLEEVTEKLKKMGVPKMVNDAWMQSRVANVKRGN